MMVNDKDIPIERQPTEEKTAYAQQFISDVLKKYLPHSLRIAWTGGKDSTVLLWLFKTVCTANNLPMPKAMFIDEGYVFEEIWEIVHQIKEAWSIELDIVKNNNVSDKAAHIGAMVPVADLNDRNRQEIDKLGFTDSKFPFEPESFVGNHLMKTVAMKMYLEDHQVKALATAIRWDEQEARIQERYISPRQDPEHDRIHPILHFTERDIWNLIHANHIPFCSLYYQGYRSLGAKGSTVKTSDIPAWEQDLENTVERAGRGQDKEDVMEQLRSLGYM